MVKILHFLGEFCLCSSLCFSTDWLFLIEISLSFIFVQKLNHSTFLNWYLWLYFFLDCYFQISSLSIFHYYAIFNKVFCDLFIFIIILIDSFDFQIIDFLNRKGFDKIVFLFAFIFICANFTQRSILFLFFILIRRGTFVVLLPFFPPSDENFFLEN